MPDDSYSNRLSQYRPGPNRVALFAAVFTWPLLFVGGLVTTYRVGMAVPDWPSTFGINMFLYRFWGGAWGVFIEHGHRLYGAAVGLASIVLCIWFLVAEKRVSLKVLGVLTLLGVIGQGVLGGYRVRLNSTALAAVHGCTAQAFFALVVALCVLTGRSWQAAVLRVSDLDHLRRRAIVTLALVYAQIAAGALLRHFGTALVVHVLLALAVWGHAAALAWRIERDKKRVQALLPSSRAMAVAVSIQVLLGVVAWWLLRPFDGIARPVSTAQALFRTAHQANAGLLLAALVVLCLRSYRSLAPAAVRIAQPSPSASLEMVA